MYKLYYLGMSITVTSSEFRGSMSKFLDAAQREPVHIASRGARPRAVVVSVDFFERAMEALEDLEDLRDAIEASREEGSSVTLEELERELEPEK